MNKAVTDGLTFMPTPFSAGLGVWSREDGTPGSDTYQSAAGAAYVPNDQDFGGCLELVKAQSVQRLRYMVRTPILEGVYLRVTARVKALSGNLPSVRIAAYPGRAGGARLSGVPSTGAETEIRSYGEVVEVSAIVGIGARPGVDLVWGPAAEFGHFGIDLTGPNGGVIRVDDLVIEDVTNVFLRELINIVDVRDYGALGDGVTDDSAAFEAADRDANGRAILVSAGTYFLNDSVTIDNPVIFEGRLVMPTAAILSLTENFTLGTYVNAFGDEELALKKALQSLMNDADHVCLDMGGRRVDLSGPIDVAAAVPNRTSYAQRRVLRNGQLQASAGGDWDPEVVTARATYSASRSTLLTNVQNIGAIRVGALVEGAGVGRAIFVREVDTARREITLSQPLSDAVGTQNYTFTRFKFMLDFSGFERIDVFQIDDVEFQCSEIASGVLLAPSGTVNQIRHCVFNRPGHRGIASPGEGCQGLLIEHCQFISFEGGKVTQNRQSVAINTNGNDVKIRDCRASQFRHFLVMSGAQGLISGNHFFQGDASPNGVRSAGIVVALKACNTSISGNYIDNCFVEWTNERDPEPDFTGGFGFAGLSITDNVFLCSNVAPWFSYIVVKPYGRNHRVNGLNVSGNTFRSSGGIIDRVERVDDSFAPLELDRMRRVSFTNNTFNNIVQATRNPLLVSHAQGSAADTWVIETGGDLPFGGYATEVDALVHLSRLRNEANVSEWWFPYVSRREGSGQDRVHVIYPGRVRGDISLTVRMD